MSPLTVYREDISDSTVISNAFIDEFMLDANDAELKIYLYLLRMVNAGLPVSVSDMADRFNHTEKDILRCLKYWEKKNLFSLEFNDQKALTGIRFLSVTGKEARTMGQIVPMKFNAESEEGKSEMAENEISYSRDEIKEFKNSPESAQILFVAESYLKKVLSTRDIETLIYMNRELNFSCELIDYLLQYCVEKEKRSLSYIKAVAIDWSKQGITDAKAAKAYLKSYDNAHKKTQKQTSGKNNFNQFKQTDYDFDELEKQLLSN